MALNYVTITGTFDDGTGTAVANGTVTFVPSQSVYAGGMLVETTAAPIQAVIKNGTLQTSAGGSVQLLATDNTGLTYQSLTGFFFWTVYVSAPGLSVTFSFFLSHSPSTADLLSLANTQSIGPAWAGGTATEYIAPAVVALTYGATIAVSAAAGNDFRVTLTGATALIANPGTPVDGQRIDFQFTQDATGSRVVTWGTAFNFGAAGAPVLTTTASKTDLLGFIYNATAGKWFYAGGAFGF